MTNLTDSFLYSLIRSDCCWLWSEIVHTPVWHMQQAMDWPSTCTKNRFARDREVAITLSSLQISVSLNSVSQFVLAKVV